MRTRYGLIALSILVVMVLLSGLSTSGQFRSQVIRELNMAPAPNPMHKVETLLAGQTANAPASITVRVNPKDGLKYNWIPPGSFEMGCSPGDNECDPDEKPSHHVTISKGFWLGQTVVTVAAYKKFVESMKGLKSAEAEFGGTPPGQMPKAPKFNPDWKDEQMPIVDVTWADAQRYCAWSGGRLPSEAEWEYAARAGSTASRYGAIDDVAWYGDNAGKDRLDTTKLWSNPKDRHAYLGRLASNGNMAHEVAQKRPNAFGLYDMLGNVYQYTNDWYGENYYAVSPNVDPPGPKVPDTMQYQVLRGGSWVDQPIRVRVSYRDGRGQGFMIGIDSFRVVWEAPAP